jgi:mRNA interferase HigB
MTSDGWRLEELNKAAEAVSHRELTHSRRKYVANANATHFSDLSTPACNRSMVSRFTTRNDGVGFFFDPSFPLIIFLLPYWDHVRKGRMRIIARRTLREFVRSLSGRKDQPAVKAALDAWFDEASRASWKSTADVKRRYATASIVSAERIVFNIKGNDYRLVVAVDFEKGIVWIKWIGTHKAYDKIDVTEVRHGN